MLGVVWVRWVLAALLGWRKGFTWMEFPDGADGVVLCSLACISVSGLSSI